MRRPSLFRRTTGLFTVGTAAAITMAATISAASAQTEEGTAATRHHDGERHVYHSGDGEYLTAEGIEAMIPSREELAAMIPTEAELRAMIPSEAELQEMVPDREELLAMIPVIESVEACHASGEAVHSEESTDPATGREHLRLMICREALAVGARAGALEGLREARTEIASEADIPSDIRADVLATLDAQIAMLSR